MDVHNQKTFLGILNTFSAQRIVINDWIIVCVYSDPALRSTYNDTCCILNRTRERALLTMRGRNKEIQVPEKEDFEDKQEYSKREQEYCK